MYQASLALSLLCLAFGHVLEESRPDDLDPRSLVSVFVWFVTNRQGYSMGLAAQS